MEDDWGPKMSEKCHIMRWLDSRTALVVFEDEAQEVPTFDKAVDEHLRRLLQHQEMEIEHGQDDDDTLTWEVGIRTVCSFHEMYGKMISVPQRNCFVAVSRGWDLSETILPLMARLSVGRRASRFRVFA